jgi:cardiolipin synthase
VWHKNEISNTYIDIFRHSHKEIIILCSYFIPGRAIRRQLKQATKRGVSIKLIVAGKSDIPIAKHAERWLYDWLLRNKISVFEYQKNILHGKIAVADDNFVTIGSYNINNLSTYVSIELNIDIKDEKFAGEVIRTLNDLEKNDCIKITEESHKKRKNIFLQFYRWLCYQLIKHTLKLFTFYYKRKS